MLIHNRSLTTLWLQSVQLSSTQPPLALAKALGDSLINKMVLSAATARNLGPLLARLPHTLTTLELRTLNLLVRALTECSV